MPARELWIASASVPVPRAEAEGIPFTVTASARGTGTDADAFHISRAGIPSSVVSVPLRYMHSPVEMVQLDDVDACARLIAAFALEPGVAVVVDVTHATDAPGIEVKEIGKHELGSGPVIERGSIISPGVFELLHETAEAEGIPFTVAASARYTGTDADAIHISRAGVPTGVVSIPLRYMHSPVELVQLDDVENTAKLLAAFAKRLDGASFER